MKRSRLSLPLAALGWSISMISFQTIGHSLPPPEEVPEEILRTEIVTEARSPIDGEPLSAAEYAELQAQLEAGPDEPPELSPKVQEVITLLRLRRTIRSIFPFLLR